MQPPLIVYGSTVVNEAGEVLFFEDLYAHDTALERALAAPPAQPAG
jgi:murein L,D-transpeptidase YcbB/YkuD